MKTDGKFHKGRITSGTAYFMAVEDMNAVAVFTKMHIHHGKTLLFVYSAIILSFLPKEVNKLQNNSSDKKLQESGEGVSYFAGNLWNPSIFLDVLEV